MGRATRDRVMRRGVCRAPLLTAHQRDRCALARVRQNLEEFSSWLLALVRAIDPTRCAVDRNFSAICTCALRAEGGVGRRLWPASAASG